MSLTLVIPLFSLFNFLPFLQSFPCFPPSLTAFHLSLFFLFFQDHLFESQREIFYPLVFSPNGPVARAKPGSNQEFYASLLCGWQVLRHLDHLPLLSQVQQQGAELEAAQHGLKRAMLNAGTAGDTLQVMPQCQPLSYLFSTLNYYLQYAFLGTICISGNP